MSDFSMPARYEVRAWLPTRPASEINICGGFDTLAPAVRQADALVDPARNPYLRAEIWDRQQGEIAYETDIALPAFNAEECLRPRARLSALASRLPSLTAMQPSPVGASA